MQTQKQKAINFDGFQPDHGESIARRTMEALDWAAKKFPYQFAPYGLLLRAIMGYKHTPKARSQETERFRHTINNVGRMLVAEREREIVAQPGVGVRATVDDYDKLRYSLSKRGHRLVSAKNKFIATHNAIDATAIPKTEDAKPWRDWYVRGASEIVRMVASPEFERKALPPVEKEPQPPVTERKK